MKTIQSFATFLLIFLCAGCAAASSEPASQSYADSVTEACRVVQIGLDQEGINNETRDYFWLKAATQFRNLSNENQAFNDYAEALNSWASGGAGGKILQVFDFCGTKH